MQTKQIYYEDQYKKSLTAKIVAIETNVSMASLILNETIFYPEGGGQPSDQGTIIGTDGKLEVQQVVLKDNEIVHIGKLTGKLVSGEQVDTSIDWNRRLTNMRVHSAGHIINDAVGSLFPELIPVGGEHGKKSYIKYNGHLDRVSFAMILAKANEIIDLDLPIATEFVTLEELKKRATFVPENLPKNKPLRIMQIGEFSVIPDGGTQVKRTGEIDRITEVSITNEGEFSYVNYKIIETAKDIAPGDNPAVPTFSATYDSNEIINVKNQAIAQIAETKDADELEQIRIELFGKNGKFTSLLKSIKDVPQAARGQFGSTLNEAKRTIEDLLNHQKTSFKENARTWFDPTIPVSLARIGNLHPTSIVINEMVEIFKNLGFSVMEGPEMETDHYNFELLNLPKDHPARSLQDVLYINEPELLLRSHTSSVETRSIETLTPPFRVVVAGKCYRFENVNASNNAMFYQFQGFALQKGLSLSDLKGTLFHFVKNYFGEERKIRFRCKYYPEVEPGVGLDLDCQFCNQKGCTVCKGRGWIEMLGAGMIHPNILKNFGINSKEITGFAFGMGLDRIVMDRFKIKDIRSLYNGDIKY